MSAGREGRRRTIRYASAVAAVGLVSVLGLVLTGAASATLNSGMTQVATGSVAPGASLASPVMDTTKTGLMTWAAYSTCNDVKSLVPLMSTGAANAATGAVFPPVRETPPKWDGTRTAWAGQYETGGLTQLRMFMQNTSTLTCTLTLFAALQDTTGISGTVSVTNFPATQPVSVTNFPSTQTVSCPSCGSQTITDGTAVSLAPGSEVELGSNSSARLDLVWIGGWLLGGITFAASIGRWLYARMKP